MHAILYDQRDIGRGCTLRVFDGPVMILQAWMHGPDPVALARQVSAGLIAEMQYVGPKTTVSGKALAAGSSTPEQQPAASALPLTPALTRRQLVQPSLF